MVQTPAKPLSLEEFLKQPETKPASEAMSKSYTTNLTQEQWELIEPLIPLAKKGGRDREVDMWAVINAIFYIVTQGCTWRNLPILDFGLGMN